MTKLATVALALLTACAAMSLSHAHADPQEGKPVPLFPKLSWGLSEQAALSKGLTTYKNETTKADVIGLPSVTIDEIEFSAQAHFGKKDMNNGPLGLNYVLLQHKDFVPTRDYSKFLHAITDGFMFAGRGSDLGEASIFFNAVDGNSHLIVTSSNQGKVSLSVAIAPGVSK